MGEYKLIALDIDGTLLNHQLELPPANRAAIQKAAAAGKQIALSTGRCLSEIRDLARELPEIRYMVCENGSCVYDLKYEQTIHVDPVPPEEVRRILNVADELGAVVQVFHENQPYFNRANSDFADACGVATYRETFHRTAVFDEKLFDHYDERPFRIEKVNLYFTNEEARRRSRKLLADRPLKITDSIGWLIEFVSDVADKGRGLEKLCRHLGIEPKDAIAVGDSENDVEILSAAGFSAAMGNACPAAKAAATVIAPDCDHAGVAWVIENYLLP